METLQIVLLSIEKYGLAPTLVILTILMVYQFVKDRNIELKIQQKIERDYKNMQTSKDRDPDIKNVLENILLSIEADWVLCWQFNNGVSSISGVPFIKMSITHEAIGANKYSLGVEYKDIQTSIMLPVPLSTIDKVNSIFIDDFDKVQKTSAVITEMCKHRIKTLYSFPIKNIKGDIMGLVVACFSNKVELSDHDKEETCRKVSAISVYLQSIVAERNENKKYTKGDIKNVYKC